VSSLINSRRSQAIERRPHSLAAPPTTRRRIDNGKKSFVHE